MTSENRRPCFLLIQEVPDTKDIRVSFCFDLHTCQVRMRDEGFRAFELGNELISTVNDSTDIIK